MSTLVWLEHAFAEAEAELDALVGKVTAWRTAPRVWVDFDSFSWAWTVRDATLSDAVVARGFASHDDAAVYARFFAAERGGEFEDGEIPL